MDSPDECPIDVNQTPNCALSEHISQTEGPDLVIIEQNSIADIESGQQPTYYNNAAVQTDFSKDSPPEYTQLPSPSSSPYDQLASLAPLSPLSPSSPSPSPFSDEYQQYQPPINNQIQPQALPQPYYEIPASGLDPVVVLPITRPIPYYNHIDGVFDIDQNFYFVSKNDLRSSLQNIEPNVYTKEDFDANRGPTTSNKIDTLIGLCGICFAGSLAAYIWYAAKFGSKGQLWLVLVPFCFFVIYYYTFWITTYICWYGICRGTTGSERNDQLHLKSPYYTAIYRQKNYGRDRTIQILEQVSKDIPQLHFEVRASHIGGTKKNRHKVTSYRQLHRIPILHYRHLGVGPTEFVNNLNNYHSGEVVIQYLPKIELHQDQLDYISKCQQLILEANKHRDSTVEVTPIVQLWNKTVTPPDQIGFFQDTLPGHQSTTNDPATPGQLNLQTNQLKTPQEIEFENSSRIPVQMATSMGIGASILPSDGKRATGCVKCFTTPFMWTIGMLFWFAPCLLCIWHKRFATAQYYNRFRVIFADFEDFKREYEQDQEAFIGHDPVLRLSAEEFQKKGGIMTSNLQYKPGDSGN